MSKRLLGMFFAAILMAMGMSAYALEKVNGAYQIGTAEDFSAFAELVNGGQRNVNAVLTADIDLGATTVQIGIGGDYNGVFNGAGHTITVNLPDRTDGEGPALFRGVGTSGIVQNLKVQGTITTGTYKHTAAIANFSGGIIRNCFADVVITSSFADDKDASIGGLVGQLNRPAIIDNCLSKIKIIGSTTHRCGGLAAWVDAHHVSLTNNLVLNDPETNINYSDGKSAGLARVGDNPLKVVELDTYNADSYNNRPWAANGNNYVTNNWGVDNPVATVVTTEDLTSGKICFQLNSDQSQIRWVQNIGDAYPVPTIFGKGKGQVYASVATNCQGVAEGDVTFSNTPSNATVTKHTYDKYGVCTTCGKFNFNGFDFDDPNRFDPETKSLLLASTEDLYMAESWNRFQNGFRLNLKMVNDITCSTPAGQFIFNTNDWSEGNFDGGGHALTIEMTEMGDYASLFPQRHYGTVENLIMHGKIETSGKNWGSISASGYESAVRNVFSDIDFVSSRADDNSGGGFIGVINVGKNIENCVYAGTITLPGIDGGARCARVGGFAGWASNKTTFRNCAVLGTFIGAGDQTLDDNNENSGNIARNYGNVVTENVYVLNPITGKSVTDQDKYTKIEDPEGIASGELAYFLNGKENGVERFFQKIGEDPKPLPIKKEGALVYCDASQFRCDGLPLGAVYQNTPTSAGEPVIPPHNYVDGFCSVCGKMQEDFVPVVDGWCEAGTPGQLKWLSVYALEHTDVCIRLTDDIDYTEYPDGIIGTDSKRYSGTFDGQGHTVITNIKTDVAGGTGLFGSVVDATIKNLVLEGTIESSQKWIGGIAGITRGDKTLIENVLVKSTVRFTGSGDSTAGGLCGDMEGAFTVNNCAFVGSFDIPNGTNVGGFVSWTGSGKFNNCYVAPVEVSGESYKDFIHGGAGSCNNCYAANNAEVKEQLTNGELCYLLNGKQFRNTAWYQLIGEDEYPNFDSSHGAVLKIDEEYYSLAEQNVSDVVEALQSYYTDLYEESIAYTGVIENFDGKIEDLENVTTVPQLEDALDSILAAEALIEASTQVYIQYQTKCEEVISYLKEHKDLSGPDRVELEAYLDDRYPEIMEEHNLPDSLVQKETVRVEDWLTLVVKNGVTEPGKDMTPYFVNADFHDGVKNGWTSSMNKYPNDHRTVTINEKPYYGCEAWNTKFDIHQTVKGLKPGYYLVGVQGAFRPGNDRYSYNYAAQVYANNNTNYLQSVIEDYVSVGNANDGENVYLSQFGGGDTTYDWPIYEDGFSTSGEEGLKGYVLHGPSGVAVAGYAGRCQNYVIAKTVGDSLTIGLCNPGTNYGQDWTGFTSFSVVYAGEGDEAETYVDKALESMVARANTILENYRSKDVLDVMKEEGQYPNYPVAIKEALQAAVAAADAAQGTEAKMKVVETLSQLFKDFYEGRQVYLALLKSVSTIEAIEDCNLPLVEKDQNGEWVEKDEYVFDDNLYDVVEMLADAYARGSYSIEEAKNAAAANIPELSDIVPLQDEDGYYLISNPKQFVAYRAIFLEVDHSVKAKLVNDIDMTGIGMQPFGNNTVDDEDEGINFSGVLDGQGHALENVYIKFLGGRGCALFFEMANATVKNLKLTGEYYGARQRMGGLTRYTSGAATIENCEFAVELHNSISGDATSGGIMGCSRGGGNVVVNNCIVNCTFIGENAHSFGGVCGWRDGGLTLNNVLILNQYKTAEEPTSYPSDILARNGCTANNVYYAESTLAPGVNARGTKATDAQLASGEICYKLNGENQGENAVWYQTLGEDATPVLDKTHQLVVYDEVLGYHNEILDPDFIEDITPSLPDTKGAIYNLAGQRVNKVQKGIYIMNGKKVLFR